MARTLKFVPLATPENDISVNHLPYDMVIVEFVGRVEKSKLIASGGGQQANLEFGIMAVADWDKTQRMTVRKFTIIGPDMEVPTGAIPLRGLVPLPNNVPLYLFELPV